MGNYFVPSKGMDSWRELLADPCEQWKEYNSAYELAKCWGGAEGLPSSVDKVFKSSHIPTLENVQILYGFPEYKVAMRGGGAASQNDLYVLAKAGDELLTVMVEGKVSEPFGEEVRVWKGDNPSSGKRNRLEDLLGLLNLKEEDALDKRYQLFHRTASAMIEAKKVNAKNAMVLIHSFSPEAKWFVDYRDFVDLFGIEAAKDSIVGPVLVNGINLYFGWVTEKI
jgi:hypothetical protein